MLYLFPTDGSDHSKAAENVIFQLLDPERDRIHALTVIDQEPNPFLTPENTAKMESNLLENANEILNDVSERLQTEGFSVTTETEHGDPGTVICDVAEDPKIDGIVMGRRGRGTAGEILLGSVSQYVVHHADCPVTLVTDSEDT